MRMAGGVGASGLVLDRSNDAQDASACCVAVDAKTVRAIHARQGLRLRMACVTGFRSFIDHMILFGRIGRISDPAFLVKDPYLFHAGLSSHRLNGAVQPLTVVPKHVVGRAVLDDIADTLRAEQCVLLQMLPVQANVEIAQQREDQHHRTEQEEVQLGAETQP